MIDPDSKSHFSQLNLLVFFCLLALASNIISCVDIEISSVSVSFSVSLDVSFLTFLIKLSIDGQKKTWNV